LGFPLEISVKDRMLQHFDPKQAFNNNHGKNMELVDQKLLIWIENAVCQTEMIHTLDFKPTTFII